MHNRRRFFILPLLLVFSFSFVSCGKGKWLFDMVESMQRSGKLEKNIFMVVGDDSKVSTDFRNAVLESDAFLKSFGKDYVLLYLDATDQKNRELVDFKYYTDPGRLPALLLLSPEGYVLAFIPYEEKYMDVAQLQTAVGEHKGIVQNIQDLIAAVQAAQGSEKVQAIDALYEATEEDYRGPLDDLCRQVLTLDASNNTGLLGKYELIVAYIDCVRFLQRKDYDKARLIFELVAQDGHLDNAQRFEAYTQAAFVYTITDSSDYAKIQDLLQKAYSSDENNIRKDQIDSLIEWSKIMQSAASSEIQQEE